MNLLIKGQLAVLKEGYDERNTESHNDGHDIEAHLTLDGIDIFEIDAIPQIEDQENEDGKERLQI